MASAGFFIYSGIMPLLKTYITIFCGYFLEKKGLFPAVASKGASQVALNISLPALVFANIVPAFTPQNISALGPLFLAAFVYMFFGFLGGAVIREVCYVPRNFWQGIIVLSGMSSWGNLPTAVVLSVTQQAPFDPTTDPQLGVSFSAIFIMSYNLLFWVFGAGHSLAWDYLPGVPQGRDAERRYTWDEKPLGSLFARYVLRRRSMKKQTALPPVVERAVPPPRGLDIHIVDDDEEKNGPVVSAGGVEQGHELEEDPDVQLARRVSRISAQHIHRPEAPSPPTDPSLPPLDSAAPADSPPPRSPAPPPGGYLHTVKRLLRPLAAIVSPVPMMILVSLPIALVQPLKALFVDVSSTGGPDWTGPDGKPPLAFVIDTASFVGNVAVPLALIMLGASFARFRIPRPLSRLPLAAIASVTALKMALLPAFGIAMVQAMVRGGLIPKEAKAERFVAMFMSGTPAAINQMIVASLYSPDGDLDTLLAFLLVQYVFMFISSSAITAIALFLLQN